MKQRHLEQIDPGTCVDFTTHGNVVSDKYREGWEKVFGKRKWRNPEDSWRKGTVWDDEVWEKKK